MTGDEAAGVGVIAPDLVTAVAKRLLDQSHDFGGARGSVRVAQHETRPVSMAARRITRHRVAVDHQTTAK